ncbi:hypothetical protein RJ640_012506, partial [Escallonia rubra]
MESDRANPTSADGVNDVAKRVRPLHGRTTGPTRRSTKGQWSSEEDEILCKAVQRFKGKNWKKIAECFKDRTDVQCLHRWQKVLNPELIKGPWSKEEDEIIIQLVNQYGAKKWSTIAQHLPGRIGKQCRERWHNHLNPAINKEAWTQEEELALIRAHQIYGNKWAELTKYLPGRTDNAIKNHWNSSVKKKLDSYLQSGLLQELQGLPHVSHTNQSMLSSSSSCVQQSSADGSIPKDGTEAEEVSECSQGSTVVGISQSVREIVNGVVHTREDCRLTDESNHVKDSSSSPASCSENYQRGFHGITFAMPDEPGEERGSSKYFEHNFSNEWLNSALDLEQESSGYLHCIGGNENQEVVHCPLPISVGLSASTSMEYMVMSSEKPEYMVISEQGCSRPIYPEARRDGSTDSLVHPSSNYQIPDAGTLDSHSYYSLRSDMLETSCRQPFPISSHLRPDEGPLIFGADAHQFNDHSHGTQEQEPLTSMNDGFVYTNDSSNSPFNDGTDDAGRQDQLDQTEDPQNLVPADAFGLEQSDGKQSCPTINENPVMPAEQQDAGALFYEPPRFPSLDVPFFSCDLIQSGTDMQQEYSPLGIRQLMMSSVNCFTPFRLWDSPSRDSSPDAVLKSAAKSFTCTPSILKKRHRDLVSPLSEKRSEKKLESDLNQESFSNLTKDFSRLDVMFEETETDQSRLLSPSADQNRNSEAYIEDKENLRPSVEVVKKEDRDGTALLECGISGKEVDSSPQDKLKLKAAATGFKIDNDADAASQIQRSGFLKHKMNDKLFFSPDQIGTKSERAMDPNARTLEIQCSRGSEAASIQTTASEVSSKSPCLSVASPPTIRRKKGGNYFAATLSTQPAPSSAPLEITTGPDALAENLSIFGETPFKRSFESPSAWKSPWFINSFLPGPRVDTDITIEDIGYFMSPGDRSYDAIGLMKQLSEHTAAAFADAQEVLGDETPDTILRKRSFSKEKADEEENLIPANPQEKNHSMSASNVLESLQTERRTLDFSECGTPGKGTESGRFSTAMSFPSPSSYLLKGC